ncbi:hypothetical protein GOODEAATRI_003203 [Goodea atripinnis]|uniref:Uncharacterized protein n=1 Tax=Goodea atripinnis TaxID=208336 RepID=A0ABV0N0C1_9TELE
MGAGSETQDSYLRNTFFLSSFYRGRQASACVLPRFNFLHRAFNHTFCSGSRWSTVRSPTAHGAVTHTEFTVEVFGSPDELGAACRLNPQSGTGLLGTGTPVIWFEGPKKCQS